MGEDGGGTNNQLNRISKRRVEQSSHSLAQLHGNLLSRKREDGSERDNGEEVEHENGRRTPLQLAGDDAQRHDNEQEVNIIWVVASAHGVSVSLGTTAPVPPPSKCSAQRISRRMGTHC